MSTTSVVQTQVHILHILFINGVTHLNNGVTHLKWNL